MGRPSERFKVDGKRLHCLLCGHDRFVRGDARLYSTGMAWFNLTWTGASAVTLACERCGRVDFFLQDPEEELE